MASRRAYFIVYGITASYITFTYYPSSEDRKAPVRIVENDVQQVVTKLYRRTVHYFDSQGVKCEGWLYTPNTGKKHPVVIMGHGMGLQKDCGLQPFVDAFTQNNMAVFSFDYRGFGGSEGTIRHEVDGPSHVEDFLAAIDFVNKNLNPIIDNNRLAVWGTSFSGGHSLVAAATYKEKKRIKCAVSNVPYIDFFGTMFETIRNFGFSHLTQMSIFAFRDISRSIFYLSNYYIPIAGPPGSGAFMSTADSQKYLDLIPENPRGGWKNRMRACIAICLPLYRPVKYLSKVECPVLLIGATNDLETPFKNITLAKKELGDKATVVEVPGGHFDQYLKPVLQNLSRTPCVTLDQVS